MLRIGPDTSATALLSQMRDRHVQTAVVHDAAGRTVGLITVDDILESLLGGVADEFKTVEDGSA
jgi:CBS domain containing-hemolysin-like protein